MPEADWLKLGGHGNVVQHGVVALFGFGGWDVTDKFEEPPVVEPVDPFERGELDGLERSPRSATVDHLGLVKPLIVSAKALRLLYLSSAGQRVLLGDIGG